MFDTLEQLLKELSRSLARQETLLYFVAAFSLLQVFLLWGILYKMGRK